MYAIIATGGKQVKVEVGQTIFVEKLANEEGSKVEFKDVLLVSNDKDVKVGTPLVKGAVVKGTLIKQGKERKVVVFKYKAKSNYRRKSGHRQPYSKVVIESIEVK